MDGRRLRIDLFAFALGALALLTFGFFAARNGAAVIMCALCFAGLIAARVVGFSNRALVPLPPASSCCSGSCGWIRRRSSTRTTTSAIAHGIGGLLVGWAVSEYLRGRVEWPLWAIGAVAVVFGLTVLWELGEWLGDRALDTGADPEQARLGARHRLRHPRRRGRRPGRVARCPSRLRGG